MHIYNDRENFRVDMQSAVSFIDLGITGRLVIIRAEEDGFPPKRTFKRSRDLFYIVAPDVNDEDAVKRAMDAGRDLKLLKNAIEYIESLEAE